MIFQEQLLLGGRLATQSALAVIRTTLPQVHVQLREVPHLRHGNKAVQPRILHPAFHHALFIAPGHLTEVVIKQVMTLEVAKSTGQLPFLAPANDLRHRNLGVVIRDAPGHASEELEPLHMAFPKGLRAFTLKGHHEVRIAVGQRHHHERHLAQPPIHLHQGLPEIHLRLAGSVDQGHKHLPPALRQFPHLILYNGVAARKPRLLQAFPDPFGRMTLLAWQSLILLQELFDLGKIRFELLTLSCLALPVARWFAVLQYLLQRLPVHSGFPDDLPLTNPFYQYTSSNLAPLLHISVHPFIVDEGATLFDRPVTSVTPLHFPAAFYIWLT